MPMPHPMMNSASHCSGGMAAVGCKCGLHANGSPGEHAGLGAGSVYVFGRNYWYDQGGNILQVPMVV